MRNDHPHEDPYILNVSAAAEPLDRWQRASRVVVFMLVLAGLGVAVTLFWPEVERLREIENGNNELAADLAMLKAERDALKQEYEWLRDDPQYLEMVARDRLNLQKDGETVFRIKNDD
ncbi:MAG: septum formation initiator family protein [Verrucomicrobiota bacterium]